MTTIFVVDGVEHSVEIRDSNNIDWSADFIGNTAHGMEMDNEGRYVATTDELKWWQSVMTAHKMLDKLVKVYYRKYGEEAVTKWLHKYAAWERDLEDQPGSVMAELDALDEYMNEQ